MTVDLKRYGTWALVTGASSGLGRAFARLVAERGMNCVLVALDEEGLERLAAELTPAHGVECRTAALDLSDERSLERLRTLTADLPIGLLVNNAGVGCGGAFATRDPDRVARLVKLNCVAPVLLVREFLPGMLERGAGAIIMVASLQAFISSPFEAAYCASKAFSLHFGESLWGELRDTPIDVITVCPAGMKTDFFKAEGFSAEDCDRMWRVSSTPESVAALAIRRLGRQPTVSPAVTWLTSMLGRVLPRRWVIHASDFITRRLVHMDRSSRPTDPAAGSSAVPDRDTTVEGRVGG